MKLWKSSKQLSISRKCWLQLLIICDILSNLTYGNQKFTLFCWKSYFITLTVKNEILLDVLDKNLLKFSSNALLQNDFRALFQNLDVCLCSSKSNWVRPGPWLFSLKASSIWFVFNFMYINMLKQSLAVLNDSKCSPEQQWSTVFQGFCFF